MRSKVLLSLLARARHDKSPYCQVAIDRHFVNGGIMDLAYHVILQNHVMKGSCDFWGESLSF